MAILRDFKRFFRVALKMKKKNVWLHPKTEIPKNLDLRDKGMLTDFSCKSGFDSIPKFNVSVNANT